MRFYKGLFDHELHLLQDSGQFFIYMGGGREHWTVNFEYPSLFVKFPCLKFECKGDIIGFFFSPEIPTETGQDDTLGKWLSLVSLFHSGFVCSNY